jgi:hypothetical protein
MRRVCTASINDFTAHWRCNWHRLNLDHSVDPKENPLSFMYIRKRIVLIFILLCLVALAYMVQQQRDRRLGPRIAVPGR